VRVVHSSSVAATSGPTEEEGEEGEQGVEHADDSLEPEESAELVNLMCDLCGFEATSVKVVMGIMETLTL
jgi:hypothetical protein